MGKPTWRAMIGWNNQRLTMIGQFRNEHVAKAKRIVDSIVKSWRNHFQVSHCKKHTEEAIQ
ncbi:hypothetical protein E2542_SST11583 [Spatholobus suberectus]|nr:hypothetical protein E2542_SST11583 [Spatholobus suberectus]